MKIGEGLAGSELVAILILSARIKFMLIQFSGCLPIVMVFILNIFIHIYFNPIFLTLYNVVLEIRN